jgi:hypothetical protein
MRFEGKNAGAEEQRQGTTLSCVDLVSGRRFITLCFQERESNRFPSLMVSGKHYGVVVSIGVLKERYKMVVVTHETIVGVAT